MTWAAVVVTSKAQRHLEACLQSLLGQNSLPSRLIVVDNDGGERSLTVAESIQSHARQLGVMLTLIELPQDVGHTRGANHALQMLLGIEEDLRFALLLDQDAVLEPNWCDAITAAFEADARIGVVGSKITSPNRLTVQHAGGFLERPRWVGRHYGHHLTDELSDFTTSREVEYVTVAAMAVRLTALREVGLLDEWYSPRHYADIDWCVRARAAGWVITYAPGAIATQMGDPVWRLTSGELNLFHRNRLIYLLPSLSDKTHRPEFAAAERKYFRGAIPSEDRRAIAVGYLWLLLLLPELQASGRVPSDPASSGLTLELIELLGTLRREVLLV